MIRIHPNENKINVCDDSKDAVTNNADERLRHILKRELIYFEYTCDVYFLSAILLSVSIIVSSGYSLINSFDQRVFFYRNIFNCFGSRRRRKKIHSKSQEKLLGT